MKDAAALARRVAVLRVQMAALRTDLALDLAEAEVGGAALGALRQRAGAAAGEEGGGGGVSQADEPMEQQAPRRGSGGIAPLRVRNFQDA
jgi:hypothetical protein